MAIVSFPEKISTRKNFIFFKDDILVSKNNPATEDKCLPDENLFSDLARKNQASDFYTEGDLGYSAMLLKEKIECGKEFTFIPLRQFFYDSKTREEKERFVPSSLTFLAARAHSLLLQRESFRFCPACGTELRDDEKFSAKKCPSCERVFFPRIEPATITLIHHGEEVLLVKNKNSAYRKFACVSGFVEQGENLEQCVAREIKEETNLTVKNVRYIGSQAWPYPDQLMLAFTAEYESGELKIQEEEILEAKWFNRKNLPPESQLPNPGSVAYNLIHVPPTASTLEQER